MMQKGLVIAALCAQLGLAQYEDGRPVATLRMNAADQGVVLRHGDGPDECDKYGARDVWVFEARGRYYLHYDAAGPRAWLTALATSRDLVHWDKKGAVLELGPAGSDDSASASYGVTFRQGNVWHMFYMGTPNTTPAPNRIPSFPYLTMKARSQSPAGPWTKEKDVVPFRPAEGSYNSVTASPGFIIPRGGEYLMFYSAATRDAETKKTRRTLALARTRNLDGPWQVAPEPILPLAEQIENSSIYYERANRTWFLFTNHVGILNGQEYTDAIWVYWSKDPEHWEARNKAVVLDTANCRWSKRVVGLPSVVRAGNRLAILYDGLAEDSLSHMRRDVGLAWLDLPLQVPR